MPLPFENLVDDFGCAFLQTIAIIPVAGGALQLGSVQFVSTTTFFKQLSPFQSNFEIILNLIGS